MKHKTLTLNEITKRIQTREKKMSTLLDKMLTLPSSANRTISDMRKPINGWEYDYIIMHDEIQDLLSAGRAIYGPEYMGYQKT